MSLKLLFLSVAYLTGGVLCQDVYNVGIGISDATGPVAGITFMGYASLGQEGRGLHLRTFSRAFIFERDGNRVVYVWSDLFSIGQIVKDGVIERLQSLYGTLYDSHNVILAGSHTHSTPGGYLGYFMFDITIRGFVKETADAYIDGLTRSIIRAHENMQPSVLQYSETRVYDASTNRSPSSYLANPEEERALYEDNVETRLQQLRILDATNNTLRGLVNWFAVHPTNMNMTNRLVSSDNFGYAAMKLEKHLNNGAQPGKGEIVAAFAQSTQGDISPNTAGPRCLISGDVCDNQYLLCPTILDQCFALGPGEDMFESTKIIGTYLFEGALRALEEEEGMDITGPVEIRQQYVNMEEATGYKYDPVSRTFNESDEVSGCIAAMGYSFAAGTTDGAGLLNFTQGELNTNPLLVFVRDFLGRPTDEDIACHQPKPILLATGKSSFPYPWHPSTISIAMGRVGNLLLASIPSEFTTQSGRRLRRMMETIATEYGLENMKAVVTGFSDDYSHYVATFEEYQAQRYEAASTLYGPHTLDIYLTKLAALLRSILEGTQVDHGTPAEAFSDRLISLVFPIASDSPGTGYSFGDCIEQPFETYNIGDTAIAAFVSGHPRNNLRQEDTFVTIERLVDGQWIVVATDADWETKYIWERVSILQRTSRVHIEWEIPEDTLAGTYRIHHYGDWQSVTGTITAYEGICNTFFVNGIEEETANSEEENIGEDSTNPEEESISEDSAQEIEGDLSSSALNLVTRSSYIVLGLILSTFIY